MLDQKEYREKNKIPSKTSYCNQTRMATKLKLSKKSSFTQTKIVKKLKLVKNINCEKLKW